MRNLSCTRRYQTSVRDTFKTELGDSSSSCFGLGENGQLLICDVRNQKFLRFKDFNSVNGVDEADGGIHLKVCPLNWWIFAFLYFKQLFNANFVLGYKVNIFIVQFAGHLPNTICIRNGLSLFGSGRRYFFSDEWSHFGYWKCILILANIYIEYLLVNIN